FGRVSVVTVASGQAGQISDDWYLIEPVPGKKDAFRAAPRKSAIYQIATAIESGMEATTDVQMLLANIYLNGRRYQKAYEMYQQLSEKVADEDRALHRYYFAQSALGVGKYDEYLQHLGEAVQLDPEAYQSALVDAYLAVADKYNQSGKLDKYIEYLTLAVQQSPQTASLHLKLASALEESRRYDQAIEQWRMVLDLEPDHPQRTELLNLIKRRAGS
ncbi:MAG: tetratricopeptide repeat protein, partial [Pirellulales bacterium]|nr:tetratricopeptide repeat protein [Pirellulales bacterium]